jgi:predicted acetyltransferase
VGYAVVPWKRGRGYATKALRLMLDEAREVGLTRLELTTEPDNAASRRAIEANGDFLVETFVSPRYGPDKRLRYVIDLMQG